jgi:hypothetical protein
MHDFLFEREWLPLIEFGVGEIGSVVRFWDDSIGAYSDRCVQLRTDLPVRFVKLEP